MPSSDFFFKVKTMSILGSCTVSGWQLIPLPLVREQKALKVGLVPGNVQVPYPHAQTCIIHSSSEELHLKECIFEKHNYNLSNHSVEDLTVPIL